jgi:hypothetical protein
MIAPFVPYGDAERLRTDFRRRFVAVAQRLVSRLPLESGDAHLGSVLADHPEACRALAGDGSEDLVRGTDGALFLHLALHVALREQVATDRPPGIRGLHGAYVSWADGDRVRAEHRMLPILEEAMHHSLGRPGDDDTRAYLDALRAELQRLGGRPPD